MPTHVSETSVLVLLAQREYRHQFNHTIIQVQEWPLWSHDFDSEIQKAKITHTLLKQVLWLLYSESRGEMEHGSALVWGRCTIETLHSRHVCVSFPLLPTSTCFLKRSQLTVLELRYHLRAEFTPLVREQERALRTMEVQSCCAWAHVPSGNKAALKRKDVSWFLVCDTDVGNRQIWYVSPQNKFRDNPEVLQMLVYANVAMASIPAVHRWEAGGLIRNASSLKLLQQFYANPQWTEAPRVPKITRGLNADALCSCSFVLKSLSEAFVLSRAFVWSEHVMT